MLSAFSNQQLLKTYLIINHFCFPKSQKSKFSATGSTAEHSDGFKLFSLQLLFIGNVGRFCSGLTALPEPGHRGGACPAFTPIHGSALRRDTCLHVPHRPCVPTVPVSPHPPEHPKAMMLPRAETHPQHVIARGELHDALD